MADDLNELFRTLGRVETKVEEVMAQNAEIKETQRLAGERTETNKNLAIKAREEKELREEARFKGLDGKLTETYGIAVAGEKWIEEKGEPIWTWHQDEGSRLGGRVSILEQAKLAEATERERQAKIKAGQDGEKRGSLKAWAVIGTAFTTLGGLLVAYGKDILDAIKGALGHG